MMAGLKMIETPDAFFLFQREADLDDDVDFLMPNFYPFFGILADFLEGILVAVKYSGGARFKYIFVPKMRNRSLQKVLLNSLIGGLPYLLTVEDLDAALSELDERTIFNGFPLKCYSESDEEYLLAIALPADISDLAKPRNLAGKTLLPGPKILYPSLNLSQVEEAANILKSNDPKRISLYFGGLYEYYARFPAKLREDHARLMDIFAGSDIDKWLDLMQSGEDLALSKQAAFLEFIDRAFTHELFFAACGINALWHWADQSRDFSKDLSDEVDSMDTFLFLHNREKISGVCRCSPHLPELARILNREGYKNGVIASYFLWIPRLDQFRLGLIPYDVLLDTTSSEVCLSIWWPNFSRLQIDFLNALELKRLDELREALFDREDDEGTKLLDKRIDNMYGRFEVMPYFDGPTKLYASRFLYVYASQVRIKREGTLTDLAGNHENAVSQRGAYLAGPKLPEFCHRCGLFLAFTDEELLSIIRNEETKSTHDINQGTDWVS